MLTEEHLAAFDETECVWAPTAKQDEFLSSSFDEVLYGGAAGGGKSDALIIDALGIHQNACEWDRYKGIIFRKTYPELGELIDRSQGIYPAFYPGAKYNKTDHVWKFPSGAQIFFSFLEKDDDRYKHQGHSYQYVGWDELTHWGTPVPYLFLMSRTRSVNPKIRCYTRATTNPGGRGHVWVKNWWNIPNDGAGTQFIHQYTDPFTGEKAKSSRSFIPAHLADNPHLADSGYKQRLMRMSEHDRKRLLDGRWDVTEGQFFTSWGPEHVIDPFVIPPDWPRWRAGDWGYARPYSFGWYTMDQDKNIYRYKEIYGWGGVEDLGTRESPTEVAEKIIAMEKGERERGINFRNNILDHNCWHSRGEEVTIAELINRKLRGAGAGQFGPSKGGKGSRINGWNVCNEYMHGHKFFVFKNCHHFIRTVPALQRDEKNPEDVDTEMEDHAGDEFRYSLVSRGHRFHVEPEPKYRPKYMTFDYITMDDEETDKRSKYRLYG